MASSSRIVRLRRSLKSHQLLYRPLLIGETVVKTSLFYARPQGRPRTFAAVTPRRRFRVAACIRVKNEARFLPEWIAHHVGVGIEHVYLYNNNSADELHRVLAPFVALGLVTIIDWAAVPAFPSCYEDFLERFGPVMEWCAFLDADEFLVARRDAVLAAVLKDAVGPALALNWRYFGSSRHEFVPPGLIVENFLQADAQPDRHVKVIARPSEIALCRNSHCFFYKGFRPARDAGGRRVWGSLADPIAEPPYTIHHYVYRSRDNYRLKCGHGAVDRTAQLEQARAADKIESEFHKHNEVEDRTALRHCGETKRLLRKAGYSAPYV